MKLNFYRERYTNFTKTQLENCGFAESCRFESTETIELTNVINPKGLQMRILYNENGGNALIIEKVVEITDDFIHGGLTVIVAEIPLNKFETLEEFESFIEKF